MTRGAGLVVQTLANAGVDTIFALSGNQIMPIFDACIDADIRVIHTRHEGAAVFMADAYAQLTGSVGIALVTAGPGFANSLGALLSAQQCESPVLLLSGDSPLGTDGRGAFQEVDQAAMSAPVTKLSLRPSHAESLGTDIAHAIHTALAGRPGPVQCALPVDLLNADVGATEAPGRTDSEPSPQDPPPDFMEAAVSALADARRPVILTGPAMNRTRAGTLLDELENATDAPVVAMESPRGLSDPSLGALPSVLAHADMVLCLGKKLDFSVQFAAPSTIAEDCRLLLVDAEPAVLEMSRRNGGDRVAASCVADPQGVARALIDRPRDANRLAYREDVAAALSSRPDSPPAQSPIHPAVLCEAVSEILRKSKDAVLVIDGGEFGQWAQAGLSAPARLTNGPSGAIGGCLCYAIGAKAARPDADVFILMGDGTAGFHLTEFETAQRNGLKITAIIGNDARWNAEYQIQLRDYGENRTYACDLAAARYDQAVAGLGGHGEYVTEPGQIGAALARAAASGLPACVNVVIDGVPSPTGMPH